MWSFPGGHNRVEIKKDENLYGGKCDEENSVCSLP